MSIINCDVLILGSGPAGLSAAIYCSRALLNTILITGNNSGGQLMITSEIENYPGVSGMTGPELIEKMEKQAKEFGTQIISDHIIKIDFTSDKLKICQSETTTYTSKVVIICTGAQANWLPGIIKGSGVSGCAVCDAPFYKQKKVIVIGGGNSAVEEALYLSKYAKEVTIVHRRDKLRAEKILQKRLEKSNVKILWNHTLKDVQLINNKVHAAILSRQRPHIQSLSDTNELTTMHIDGIFIAIGHSPCTELFNKLPSFLDKHKYIITDNKCHTNIPGIFAAGDVQDSIFRQAVTAAGTGCIAALEAEKYINELN